MTVLLEFESVTVGSRLTDVSFKVAAGTCAAVLGESSSGLAEIEAVLAGRTSVTAGEVIISGSSANSLSGRELKKLLAAVSVVQSFESFEDCSRQLRQLNASDVSVIVLVDPVRSLVGSQKAEALTLIRETIAESRQAWLVLGSNVLTAKAIADTALVLYRDQVVESGSAQQVIEHAQHPYTQALISAVAQLEPLAQAERELVTLHSSTQSIEGGCAMATRCPFTHMQCEQLEPELLADDEGHEVSCFYPQERKVIVTATRRPHAVRPMPRGSLLAAAHKPDYHGPVTGRDFVSD